MGRRPIQITWAELKSRINAAQAQKGTVTIGCGSGLYLRIFGVRRSAHWYYRRDSGSKFEPIGDYPRSTLLDARRMAREKAEALKIAQDEEAARNAATFGQEAKKWLETKKVNIRFANIRKSVEYLSPLFSVPVSKITNPMVKEALLAQEITPYKLKECIGALCNIMDLAVEDELIQGHSCAILKKSPSFPKHVKGPGFKWIPAPRLGELFSRFGQADEGYKAYILLLCLTVIRPGECRQLRFEWLNESTNSIDIPGRIMKIKHPEPFRIPVAPQVRALWERIREMRGDGKFLFPRKKADEPMAERDIAVQFKLCAGDLAHPHGFRKTARTWFADNGVPYDVAAMCLDHKINNGADAAYQKSDMLELRRPVMEKWACEVERMLPPGFKELV